MTAGWDDGIANLTDRLVRELATGKPVLWLVCGGSNVPACVHVMDNISAELSQNLSLLLSDERYGPVGHKDSNWQQLLQAGFKPKQAKVFTILEESAGLAQTIDHYGQITAEAFAANNVVIAQLGIGGDGHIAGILPNSASANETVSLISSLEDPPLTRLTMTFPALRKITIAYAFAFGQPKQQALKDLQTKSLPLNQQPSQILKELPEAYVYNDQVGDQ